MDFSQFQMFVLPEVKHMALNDDCIHRDQILYKSFAIRSTESFLGISIQKERMYVVQKKNISVFDYFVGFQNVCTQKLPTLVKEIFLPFEISKYIITEKYICIKSKNKTQIRDHEFEKVYYSENVGILNVRPKNPSQETYNSNNFTFDSVEELQLECDIVNDFMVSWKVVMKRKNGGTDSRYLREYWSQKYNILTKHKSIIKCRSEMIDPNNKTKKVQICKSPLFINQLGYIQNFYIWPFSSNDIQIGIFFNQKEHENVSQNALYEICSFRLKESSIKHIFYYEFQGQGSQGKNNDVPHLFFAVCEHPSRQKSKIKIMIFEVLPEQKISIGQTENQALNNYLDQFNQLKKQKKSQQSLSQNLLLNEILEGEQKSSSSPNRPTNIVEMFTIRNSCSLRKAIYNPLTKVLWIDDTSEVTYRIKFVDSGDIKEMKQKDTSFVQKIQQFRNGDTGPQLEGIMYDQYPVFKVKGYSIEIGLRGAALKQFNDTTQEIKQIKNEEEKEIIELNDKELEKIDEEKLQSQLKTNQQVIKPSLNSIEVQTQQIQKPSEQFDDGQEQIPKKTKDSVTQQTQTDFASVKQEQQPKQTQIKISSLSEMLQELNFNKVEDTLIRFSSLFTANVTKNINKLKQVNRNAKEEIKLKINADIFDLIKEVFSTLMGDALAEKIQKQSARARQFVQKIFTKHMEHFNLLMLDEKTKQENLKKCILEEQLRSIDTIKEASLKFLDVTKIRQMQKIAYNELVIENIQEVGRKIQNLEFKVKEMLQKSQEIETKIISDVEEVKETFKLLVELEKSDSESRESEDVEEGFQSGDEKEEGEQNEQIDKEEQSRGGYEFYERKGPSVQRTDHNPYGSYIPSGMSGVYERPMHWGSPYQGPPNYPYHAYQPPMFSPNYPPMYHPVYPPLQNSYNLPNILPQSMNPSHNFSNFQNSNLGHVFPGEMRKNVQEQLPNKVARKKGEKARKSASVIKPKQ